MLTRGLVFSGKRYWSRPGTVAPAAALPDESRFANNGTFANIAAWIQLPSGLWTLPFNGASSKVTFAASLCQVQSIVLWINPTLASRSIADFDAGTHSVELNATPDITATGWVAPIIYVNGVVAATVALGTWAQIAVTTATPFTMSALVLGQEASFYSGSLALPRVYNYALDAAQINAIYAAERGLFGV